MPAVQTAPNGSFTDSLFGLLGGAIDTVGQVQVARLNRPADPPAPTTQPRSASDPNTDTLRALPYTESPRVGLAAVPPWAWIAGGVATVALTALLLRK